MFTFGFSSNTKDKTDEESAEENVLPAVEINWNASSSKSEGNVCCLELKCVNLDAPIPILYLDQTTILPSVIKIDSSIEEAEKNHSDLIEGVYEGGLKIWECTYDVANYLCMQFRPSLLGKQILDLGCGSGILGVLCYKLGAAAVHFQDYNEGVIKHLTIPNVSVNDDNLLEKSRFWCGDWKSFSKINDLRYDVIVTSETIYNPKNHRKLLSTFKTLLKSDGVVILGGKSYYFGVGGGMQQFLDLVVQDNSLTYENAWESETGVKREIIKIRRK